MRRLRRLVKWTAAAAGVLVLLVAIGLIVLQTAWFKGWLRGQAVTGMVGPTRVTWTIDRARALPGR